MLNRELPGAFVQQGLQSRLIKHHESRCLVLKPNEQLQLFRVCPNKTQIELAQRVKAQHFLSSEGAGDQTFEGGDA
jgi:hypothetical protein